MRRALVNLEKSIAKLTKQFLNRYIYTFLVIIIISLIISAVLQSSTSSNDIRIRIADNIFRVLAGGAAGGLLTVLVLNHTARVRADHSYKAIIRRIVEISGAAYVDILGNYGSGTFITSLFGSGYGPTDGSDNIEEVVSLLKEKARRLDKEESINCNLKGKKRDIYHTYGYFKYDRTKRLVEDLTNVYYRDAIYNTIDNHILEELYHCTDRGLILFGLLDGDFKRSGRLWSLAFFLELNLRLYRILLEQLGVNVEREIKVSGPKA